MNDTGKTTELTMPTPPVQTLTGFLTIGDLQIDADAHGVTRGGRRISLSPREFELLSVLAEAPGRVHTRSELCERIWKREHRYETRTVEIFITRLRRKIDAGSTNPLIHTVRTVGYALAERRPEPGRNGKRG